MWGGGCARRPEPTLGSRLGPLGVTRRRGRPLEDLGWGKEKNTTKLDDIGRAGCMDRQESAKWVQREGSFPT